MCDKAQDLLSDYSSLKIRLLERLKIPFCFTHSAVFHILVVSTLLLIYFAVFFEERRLDLFAFHPLFMSVGVIIFLTEGILVYVNGSVESFLSPIMEGSKRHKYRVIHRTLQTIGTIMILLGLIAIVSNKLNKGKSIIPDSIHGILGSIVVICIVLQSFSGFIKLNLLEAVNSKRSMLWHGDFGFFILDLSYLALLFGIFEYERTHVVIEISVIIMMSLLWISVYSPLYNRSSSSSSYFTTSTSVMSKDEEVHGGIEMGKCDAASGDEASKKPLLKIG